MAAHEEEPPLSSPVPAASGTASRLCVHTRDRLQDARLAERFVLDEVVNPQPAVFLGGERLVADAHVLRGSPHAQRGMGDGPCA